MKPTKYLAGLSAFAFASAAYADVTVNITGATAFRSAALTAIKAKFNAGGNFKYAHDKTAGNLTGSTSSIFIGTFPGITGTTTIRCYFSGSVEGIRALTNVADPLPPLYLPASVLSGTTAAAGGAELASAPTAGAATDVSDIAFSDVSAASTPYGGFSFLPSDPAAGVIVFTMLTNEGSSITNVTSQQFRALMTNGFQPRSLFSGVAADNPNDDNAGANAGWVFATGRNDGSGTRTTYLAETGYGLTNPVKQYVTIASSTTDLQKIQLVPAGGVNTKNGQSPAGQDPKSASTVWGQNVAGNGGYNSGGTLAGDMGKTGASVTVLDEDGLDAFGAPVPADLVTWLSIADAATAKTNGAVFCAYNGVKLDGMAAGAASLAGTDRNKVTSGVYTAWGYERMYRRNNITSGDKKSIYDAIKAAIPANLGAAGIPLTEMAAFRQSDGGLVAP